MSRRPTLREVHFALDKMSHHAWVEGRLLEHGDVAGANVQHALMLKERAIVLAYMKPRPSFFDWIGSLLKRKGYYLIMANTKKWTKKDYSEQAAEFISDYCQLFEGRLPFDLDLQSAILTEEEAS